MRRYVFCAALDYHSLSSDEFFNYAQRREKHLIGLSPRGQDVQVDIYEFKSGKVHTRKITWMGGKRAEVTGTVQPFAGVTRDDFETRQLKDSAPDTHAFKANRPKVMSIRDVYDAIIRIGTDAPNTLEEFSIFSHSYDEGPILVNSYNDRQVWVPERLRLSPTVGEYRHLQGTERNPDDKDCRAQFDFVAPTLPLERLEKFRAAFSSNGRVWVWGCAFDFKTNSLMSVVRRVISGKTNLSDDTVLKFRNLTIEQLNGFAEFADALKQDREVVNRTRGCDVTFGQIRRALWARVMASYTYQAAHALHVPCMGAIYGSYAEPDKGRKSPDLMSISTDTARNVSFYQTYFGTKTDAEGRNYTVFTYGMKMTA